MLGGYVPSLVGVSRGRGWVCKGVAIGGGFGVLKCTFPAVVTPFWLLVALVDCGPFIR